MAQAADYPVSFPFGATNPIGNGWYQYYGPKSKTIDYIRDSHGGDDRWMPTDTEVRVGDTIIGLSGATGAVSGPHLHLQKNILGVPSNPNGKGFNVVGVVERTGQDNANGKFVVVRDTQGVQWYYLHLSEILVSAGQQIGADVVNEDEAKKAWVLGMDLPETDPGFPGFVSYWVGKQVADMLAWLTDTPRHLDIVTKSRGYDQLNEDFETYKKANPPGGGKFKPTPPTFIEDK